MDDVFIGKRGVLLESRLGHLLFLGNLPPCGGRISQGFKATLVTSLLFQLPLSKRYFLVGILTKFYRNSDKISSMGRQWWICGLQMRLQIDINPNYMVLHILVAKLLVWIMVCGVELLGFLSSIDTRVVFMWLLRRTASTLHVYSLQVSHRALTRERVRPFGWKHEACDAWAKWRLFLHTGCGNVCARFTLPP